MATAEMLILRWLELNTGGELQLKNRRTGSTNVKKINTWENPF